jgi:hypothetical protein
MIAKLGIICAGFVLMLGVALCFSQATGHEQEAKQGDKQQEFAMHIEKANGYLREKKPALAIPEFEAAVAIDPENVDVQANLGVLLFFQVILFLTFAPHWLRANLPGSNLLELKKSGNLDWRRFKGCWEWPRAGRWILPMRAMTWKPLSPC